jgi:hypothetical protein
VFETGDLLVEGFGVGFVVGEGFEGEFIAR